MSGSVVTSWFNKVGLVLLEHSRLVLPCDRLCFRSGRISLSHSGEHTALHHGSCGLVKANSVETQKRQGKWKKVRLHYHSKQGKNWNQLHSSYEASLNNGKVLIRRWPECRAMIICVCLCVDVYFEECSGGVVGFTQQEGSCVCRLLMRITRAERFGQHMAGSDSYSADSL